MKIPIGFNLTHNFIWNKLQKTIQKKLKQPVKEKKSEEEVFSACLNKERTKKSNWEEEKKELFTSKVF